MPLEAASLTATERAARLNSSLRGQSGINVLAAALSAPDVGRVALVSSFGAESAVLLHMVSVLDRSLPVLFVDTGMLFAETLAYQRELARRLGLTGLRVIRPDPAELLAEDPDGVLHLSEPDRCCALRKVRPLERALEGFDAWITGRKRFQGASRARLELFEADGPRLKINPLAHWQPADVAEYMANNNLPRHPLVAKGYLSIGCAPCTTPVAPGEDIRAGRWRGRDKLECGIHVVNGRVLRGPRDRRNGQ